MPDDGIFLTSFSFLSTFRPFSGNYFQGTDGDSD